MADKISTNLTDQNIYASIEQEEGPGPCKSIEGYIVMCTGIHEEAQEDQIYDLFSEWGTIKSLHANLDRKTGYLKGYALIEYESITEAQKAITKLNGTEFLGKKLNVGFAFKKPPEVEKKGKGSKRN